MHGGDVGEAVPCRGISDLAHHYGEPARTIHRSEGILVGHVVADVDGPPAGKGGSLQKRFHGCAFRGRASSDLDHHLAFEHLQFRSQSGGQRGTHFVDFGSSGRLPSEVQCHPQALVFHERPRMRGHELPERLAHRIQPRWIERDPLDWPAGYPQFGTMHPGNREFGGDEEPVNFMHGSAGDECQRSVEQCLHPLQPRNERGRDLHGIGSWRQFQQRSVDVEEERPPDTARWKLGSRQSVTFVERSFAHWHGTNYPTEERLHKES